MWPRVIIPRWLVTRVKIPRWNVTPAHNSTLNCDPGSWFHAEIRPQVSIQRLIVTPNHDSTLNCHLVLGSQFNVEFWPRVIIQRGILTRGYNSTWNSDPSTYLLPVELRLKKVSKFNSVIKIQQLRRVTIQRKIHWILTPGRYSIGGSKFRHTGKWCGTVKAVKYRPYKADTHIHAVTTIPFAGRGPVGEGTCGKAIRTFALCRLPCLRVADYSYTSFTVSDHRDLKLRCTNKYIEFPSENRVLARCMPRLISFAIALSCYAARERSENFKMILPTVGFDLGSSCTPDRRVIHCATRPLECNYL